jgi:large subunit ribosomal protein L21e
MKKSHGKMRNTRGYMKTHKTRGMPPINRYLQEFAVGDKVHIKICSSEHGWMPFRRFIGQTGIVKSKQGGAYKVSITDGNKPKDIIVNPVHLKKA